ncbi:MAG: hypothetical protein ABEL97_08145 [Salinibacter sp.]
MVVAFAALLHLFRLPAYAREVGRRGRDCLAVVRDEAMADRAKEEALQAHARRLFVLLGVLGGGSVLALGLPLGVVWLLDRGGVASLPDVWATLERPDVLLGTVVVGTAGYLLVRRLR